MAKIKIRNFGPIKNGYDAADGYIEIKDVTVFIGDQGSGKSTVAKAISTLSWIEKALIRGDFSANDIGKYNRFKKQLAYQNIHNYLKTNTLIDYQGDAYQIQYAEGRLVAKRIKHDATYSFPKIMYVPAERNFVSAVDRPDLIKRLPLPLYTFLDEYDKAKGDLDSELLLPVGKNVRFEYRKQSKKSWLVGDDFKIGLLEGSSGFQSLVPLFLVTRSLVKQLGKETSATNKEMSIAEQKRIRNEIEKLKKNPNISEDVRRLYLEELSSRHAYACFINIVEEPEQNLFPASQWAMLQSMIAFKNMHPNNKLIMTTHSPYIIAYLNLAMQAKHLSAKVTDADSMDRILRIVPESAMVSHDRVSVYQFEERDGSIRLLPAEYGVTTDRNYLNESLAESNHLFDELLEIEQAL